MILFTLNINLSADGTQSVGTGTSSSPYEIATLDNLFWVSTNSSSWDILYEQRTLTLPRLLLGIPTPSVIASSVGNGTKQSAVNVALTIHNSLGQKLAALINKEQTSGNYAVKFTAAANLPSGIYLYTLYASSFTST